MARNGSYGSLELIEVRGDPAVGLLPADKLRANIALASVSGGHPRSKPREPFLGDGAVELRLCGLVGVEEIVSDS